MVCVRACMCVKNKRISYNILYNNIKIKFYDNIEEKMYISYFLNIYY